MVDFYTFEVGLDRVLVNCGHHCLYICRYPVYNNVVNFYTFEGDLYNWGWFLYIWGRFYTFEGIYTFEGPTAMNMKFLCIYISWWNKTCYLFVPKSCLLDMGDWNFMTLVIVAPRKAYKERLWIMNNSLTIHSLKSVGHIW